MKTRDIMSVYEYESCGGPIKAIPVRDVIDFCKRIEDRLEEDSPFTLEEVREVIQILERRLQGR